jgi:lipopolysaccharide exporter
MTAPDNTADLAPATRHDPSEDGAAVGRRVAIGSAFMVAGRMAIRLIGVVSTLVLVRLLLPEDFGLIGLASAAITVAEVLTQMGVGMAVVRHRSADRALFDTAWTINLARCALLGGVLVASANGLASMLGDPRIGPVIMVVGVTIASDGLMSAGLFRLQRQLRFDLIFRLEVTGRLLAAAATIVLAVLLQNYWCLVLGNLAARLVTIPLSYWLAPHRPRLCLAAWRELLHFSKWMIAANACGAIEGQAANFSIGRLAGLPALGMWQISFQIAAMPVTELAVPIRSPIYAGYAHVQHDHALLRQHFLRGFGLICAALMPLSVGIALVAPEIERLALGDAFRGAAPLIALCALYAMIDALAHFTFNLFIVLGAQRRMVLVHVLLVFVRVPAVVVGAAVAAAEGAGVALAATALLGAAAWHSQMARLLGYGFAAVAAEIWRSCAAAAVMALAVSEARVLLPAPDGSLGAAALTLAVLASLGAGVHILAQLLLWLLSGSPEGAERTVIQFIRSLKQRLLAGATRRFSDAADSNDARRM